MLHRVYALDFLPDRQILRVEFVQVENHSVVVVRAIVIGQHLALRETKVEHDIVVFGHGYAVCSNVRLDKRGVIIDSLQEARSKKVGVCQHPLTTSNQMSAPE